MIFHISDTALLRTRLSQELPGAVHWPVHGRTQSSLPVLIILSNRQLLALYMRRLSTLMHALPTQTVISSPSCTTA